MKLKDMEKFVTNVLAICIILGTTITFIGIIWNYVNPITPIEKAVTIFGSILTLWAVIYLLNK